MRRAFAALALLSACDSATARPCTGIPEGGCPLEYGTSCADPSCAAVYACGPGDRWELRAVCPARDAAAPDGAADAGAPRDASIDAPPGAFGGPGCADLQPPDCSLGAALLCSSGCCGCEDLFVCADGGWDLWGACGPDGAVHQ